MKRLLQLLPVAAACCCSLAALGVTVRVQNPAGSVTARVSNIGRVQLRRSSPVRKIQPADTLTVRKPGLIIIRAQPADGAPIDLEITLPYGYDLQARTEAGHIDVSGFLHRAELITGTGSIRLAVPWAAARLRVSSRREPAMLSLPAGFKFRRRKLGGRRREPEWVLTDTLPADRITYSRLSVQANEPAALVLEDFPIPADAPVKPPWLATRIVEGLLAGRKSPPAPRAAPKRRPREPTSLAAVEGGLPRFRSEVRLVTLNAAVTDSQGHPLADLQPADFEVTEDGVPQRLALASSGEAPFNLALLFDLSGSTRREREAMKEAARRFIGIARPRDRVAIYALAGNMFYVVSPLTGDRERLRRLIDLIPEVSGGTPLYDAIALAYAQEFPRRGGERNALIILSDGIDNQVHGLGVPSEVPFKKLLRAAARMDVLIYPVFLDPFTRVPPPEWARKARRNMQALAGVTGGRLFAAQSAHDLDPVYPQVAAELRSVYTLAYYPRNQAFDGAWRRVEVRVKRPGARVRARTGYFAR